jgi:release factor glutamine methyltransferase
VNDKLSESSGLLKSVFKQAVLRFKDASIPEPELEVSLLLARVLGMERTSVLLAGDRRLDRSQLEMLEQLAGRRLAREPLAYILAEKEFWSLDFTVSPDVLIPRPETEFLLEKALAAVKKTLPLNGGNTRILDLGTGSGVIAVVLALELEAVAVTAVDRSYKALKVACHNAKKFKVADKIDFINCNWLQGLAGELRFDAVISNPPYVAGDILTGGGTTKDGSLQPEVMDFEPRLALDGGERGTEAIAVIARQLPGVLKPGGWLFMEIGADQKEVVMAIFAAINDFESLEVFTDYGGLARVFQARKKY